MRLRRLTLERYGAFTDRALDFAPGAAAHVVFGANEAGKTTALAAVTDLLYGIEERTRFNFLHGNEELRLGAELAARDGRALAFRRRKGRRRTLLDAAETALPDDLLQPWLAGVSREVFLQSFGLSREGLRQGGQAMLAAEGEVGRSLFAAASGLTGLVELRQALADEAEALYRRNSRGTTRFDGLRRTYDAARVALRDRAVSYESWRALADRIAAAEARLGELEAEQAALRQERIRLERIRRSAPLLRRLEQERTRLRELSALPGLPADFAGRLEQGLARFAGNAQEEARLAEATAQAEQRLAALPRPAVLLAAAPRIDVLVERLESLREVERDLPKREAEQAEAEAALAALARRLGLPDSGPLGDRAAASPLLAAEPSDPQRARVRALLTERGRLTAAQDSCRRERAAAEQALAQAEAQCRSLGEAPDPERLRQRLAALRPEAEALAQRAQQQAELAQRRDALAEAGRRLRPPVPALEALADRPLPPGAALRAAQAQATDLAAEAGALKARRATLRATLEREEQALAELAAGGTLPTAETLRQARAERDALWRQARDFVLPEPPPPLDPAARRRLARDLDRALAEADDLADRREAESDRIARHAEIGRRLRELRRQEEALEGEAAELAGRAAAQAAAWRALWQPLDLVPGPPEEMQPWLAELERLLREREALAATAARLAPQPERDLRLLQALSELADAAGVEEGGGLRRDALVTARQVEAALTRLDAAWQQRRDALGALQRARDALALLPAREAASAAEDQAWCSAWALALPALGLPPDAREEEAEAALQVWSQVPEARTRRQMTVERCTRMRTALRQAQAAAGVLLAEVAPELGGMTLVPAVEELRRRCAEARGAESRARQVEEEARRLARQRDSERAALAEATAALDELAAEAALPAGEAAEARRARLAALVPQLAARAAAEAAIAGLLAELANQGDGLSEAALRQEAASLPIDAVIARVEEIEARDRMLATAATEQHVALRQARDEQALLEAGRGAEQAAQDEADALAALGELARDYLRLEAARALIATALERHRARYQDPLLSRASALFARLTGGAFAGLALDYGSDDQPQLVAQRAGGQRVPVQGLSEGTRDQLYLALRLAALAAFAQTADPPPFLCDDLLISFDDARAAFALDALAEIGGGVQVILFTHHRHVVELARRRLGAAVDVIEL